METWEQRYAAACAEEVAAIAEKVAVEREFADLFGVVEGEPRGWATPADLGRLDAAYLKADAATKLVRAILRERVKR